MLIKLYKIAIKGLTWSFSFGIIKMNKGNTNNKRKGEVLYVSKSNSYVPMEIK